MCIPPHGLISPMDLNEIKFETGWTIFLPVIFLSCAKLGFLFSLALNRLPTSYTLSNLMFYYFTGSISYVSRVIEHFVTFILGFNSFIFGKGLFDTEITSFSP